MLGRGGAADVYAGVDLRLARRVAGKVFRSPLDDIATARMESEATLLAGLRHVGLLEVHDFYVERGEPYLVTQLVEGGTLRARLDSGPLTPVEVAELGARLASIVDYLHSNGVVHRDIKPSNVLIDEFGACYLADFGIARAVGAARITGTGEFVGTATYLAPEQITDSDARPAVDVYALGLLLLEAVAGEPAYTGNEVETALARLARQPRIPYRLPPAWRSLLAAMTIRDPAKRPSAARCAELLDALRTQTTDASTTARPAPRARRRLSQVATVVTGAVLMAAALTGPSVDAGTPVGEAETPAAMASWQPRVAVPTGPPQPEPRSTPEHFAAPSTARPNVPTTAAARKVTKKVPAKPPKPRHAKAKVGHGNT